MKIIEDFISYTFKDPQILELALTHKSYAFEKKKGQDFSHDNEKLEFLGDKVLDLIISDLLMERFPSALEGELSQYRASLVNEQNLAQMARGIPLGDFLLLGRGEELSGGREKNSILASAFEAVLGALYLDGGFATAYKIIAKLFDESLQRVKENLSYFDAKTQLQELIQCRYKTIPQYILRKEEGPDHDKRFLIEVRVLDQNISQGEGRSKKEAEQRAAAAALLDLQQNGQQSG